VETDPRVQRTQAAIRDALVSLVQADGLGAVTHQRVAEVAGLGRATVYRHCPTTEALLDQALDCMDVSLPEADGDTFEAQLIAIGRKMARDANDPAGAALLLGLMERAHHDQEYRDRQTAHIATVLDLLRVKADPGVGDLELLVAQVLGPIVFRSLVLGEQVEDPFVEEVVRRALRSV
jgi:AcrR family transcriptional regulator